MIALLAKRLLEFLVPSQKFWTYSTHGSPLTLTVMATDLFIIWRCRITIKLKLRNPPRCKQGIDYSHSRKSWRLGLRKFYWLCPFLWVSVQNQFLLTKPTSRPFHPSARSEPQTLQAASISSALANLEPFLVCYLAFIQDHFSSYSNSLDYFC